MSETSDNQALAGLPTCIGRYEIRAVLGVGGMGRVVRAHDPKLKRDVAIKLVEPLAVEPEDLRELRFMFHREARATAALRHPAIVEVFDYSGPDTELMYLACELIEGPTVAKVLQSRDRQIAPPTVAALAFELCGALEVAHSRSVVHRDLKPENVFWESNGRVVLGDFGIAKVLGDRGITIGSTLPFGATNVYGSPAYMAPEQLEDGSVSVQSDLYSLGAVVFECLTGKQAFQADDLEQLAECVAKGARVEVDMPAQVPRKLARLVDELLEARPSGRPGSATHVRAVLRGVMDELDMGDPRRWLADYGAQGDRFLEEVAAESEGAGAEGPTSVAGEVPSDLSKTVRVSRVQRTAMGPRLAISLAAIAIGLGIGGLTLSRLVYSPTTARTVSAESEAPSRSEEHVSVILIFPGTARVRLDGLDLGEWREEARFDAREGVHRIAVEAEAGRISRSVRLLSGTQPRFVFERDDFK